MLWVWHKANDAAGFIRDASNVIQRAIEVVGVAEDHLAFAFELVDGLLRSLEASLTMHSRNKEYFASLELCRPSGLIVHYFQVGVEAMKMQALVGGESTLKQACFGQDLKSIANSQGGHALTRAVNNGLHHRRQRRDCTGAQVVTVGKTTWYYNCVNTIEVCIRVPKADSLCSG